MSEQIEELIRTIVGDYPVDQVHLERFLRASVGDRCYLDINTVRTDQTSVLRLETGAYYDARLKGKQPPTPLLRLIVTTAHRGRPYFGSQIKISRIGDEWGFIMIGTLGIVKRLNLTKLAGIPTHVDTAKWNVPGCPHILTSTEVPTVLAYYTEHIRRNQFNSRKE